MSRRHHYRAKCKEPPEMEVTTFLNLMVVLIPFLLISAVFSRITILELNLPDAAASSSKKPKVTVEVIIRKNKLQIGNGRGVVASFPKVDGEYNIEKLSRYLMKIKGNYPDKTDATILIEPNIAYASMIKVMDATRSVEIEQEGDGVKQDGVKQRVELFTDMSVGEAP